MDEEQEQKEKAMICGTFSDWQPQYMMKLVDVLDSAYVYEPDVVRMMNHSKDA